MACSLTFLTVLCATCNGLAFATVDIIMDDVCLVQRGVVKQFSARPFLTSSPFSIKPIPSHPFWGSFGTNKMAVPQADRIVSHLQPDQVVPNIDQIVALGPHMASVVPNKDKQVPTQVQLIQPSEFQSSASSSHSGLVGNPCDQNLVAARENLAQKTLALNEKQTEMQELERQIKSRNQVLENKHQQNSAESEKLKDSITGIEQEIDQSQRDTEVEATHMKENSLKYEQFKQQFVPTMRKELEEFKKNAGEKIQALEQFLAEARKNTGDAVTNP